MQTITEGPKQNKVNIEKTHKIFGTPCLIHYYLISTNSTIVRSLRSWKAILGPAKWMSILHKAYVLAPMFMDNSNFPIVKSVLFVNKGSKTSVLCLIQQGVLLFNSKPGNGVLGSLHHLIAGFSE